MIAFLSLFLHVLVSPLKTRASAERAAPAGPLQAETDGRRSIDLRLALSAVSIRVERPLSDRAGDRCAYHLCHPDVFVMESTEKGDGRERSSDLHGTAKRGVLSECKMGTGAIVIVGVGSEDPVQMGLAQDQDMVQAFSPDRADEPFYVSVLPGRAGRSWSVADAHRPDPLPDDDTVGAISIADEVAGRLVPSAENYIRQY